jgi:beta-glucosidase
MDKSTIEDQELSFTEKAKKLVAQMTLEEKASLCSGKDCWTLKPIERLELHSVMMCDGPHGLRKQIGETDNLGIGDSLPSTCFPTASALACSFDVALAYEVGEAIGEECLQEEVSVILGPGVNMKRSPHCGRNFEYYSEDPLLSGELAAEFIKGVQSTGVGTSLKHFAVNNQERRRMTVNAVVDERTLRETYLKAFEIAVKKGKPKTVMCAYNRLNGEYCSENQELLTKILRDEWGFDGIVVSDWGAVNDLALGVAAGLDLEMPGSMGING